MAKAKTTKTKKQVEDSTVSEEVLQIEDTITKALDEVVEKVDFKKIEEEAGIQTKEELEKAVEEELKPIKEIVSQVTEMTENQANVLNNVSSREEAEKVVRQELEKAKAIQSKINNMRKMSPKSSSKFNNFWNGMMYDM